MGRRLKKATTGSSCHGAEPIVPDMPGAGLPGVFCMRTPDDAVGLLSYVKANGCRRAAVVGAGFIGLEAAENLMAQGLSVTVIDAAPPGDAERL